MNYLAYRNVAVLALPLVFASGVSLAEPRAFLDKGQVFAIGDEVKALQVPTEDSAGKIQFYDMTIKLNIGDDGLPNPVADVAAKKSPSIKFRSIVPGVYQSTDGSVTCNVTNITLTDGRIQSFLTCPPSKSKFGLSVVTGKVNKGHPYLSELTAASITKRSDVNTQTWGLVTSGNFLVGSCGSSTSSFYAAGLPVGVKTDGKTLVVSVYVRDRFVGEGSFVCGATFIKQS